MLLNVPQKISRIFLNGYGDFKKFFIDILPLATIFSALSIFETLITIDFNGNLTAIAFASLILILLLKIFCFTSAMAMCYDLASGSIKSYAKSCFRALHKLPWLFILVVLQLAIFAVLFYCSVRFSANFSELTNSLKAILQLLFLVAFVPMVYYFLALNVLYPMEIITQENSKILSSFRKLFGVLSSWKCVLKLVTFCLAMFLIALLFAMILFTPLGYLSGEVVKIAIFIVNFILHLILFQFFLFVIVHFYNDLMVRFKFEDN